MWKNSVQNCDSKKKREWVFNRWVLIHLRVQSSEKRTFAMQYVEAYSSCFFFRRSGQILTRLMTETVGGFHSQPLYRMVDLKY